MNSKLEPPPPTPVDEVWCADAPAIKLMSALTDNPVHCMNCNLEVPSDTLGISESLAESISSWRRVHDALYQLWLDSGDYESWARSQLLNFSGQVNRLGLQAQAELNKIRKCYYMLFQDINCLEIEQMTNCPACHQEFRAYSLSKFQEYWMTCEECQLVIQAP